MAIKINGTTVIDNSGNLTNIANSSSTSNTANTYVVRDANGDVCVRCTRSSLTSATLGSTFAGGYLICKDGGDFGWIVAPTSSEVTRNWQSRCDAATTAQAITGCTGWFIPTCTQAIAPGNECRTYWDAAGPQNFRYSRWTDTGVPQAGKACYFYYPYALSPAPMPTQIPVRAFRCAVY